jgi:hypothetical protein
MKTNQARDVTKIATSRVLTNKFVRLFRLIQIGGAGTIITQTLRVESAVGAHGMAPDPLI